VRQRIVYLPLSPIILTLELIVRDASRPLTEDERYRYTCTHKDRLTARSRWINGDPRGDLPALRQPCAI
jgi:hypothetical protein